MDHIEYRTETEAPTEEGLYWGHCKYFSGTDLAPFRVARTGNSLKVLGFDVHDFRWFGPVTMVKESGAE